MSDYMLEAQEEMWDAIAAQDDETADRADQRRAEAIGAGRCPYCHSTRFTDDDGARICEGCGAEFPTLTSSS